ncbi:hypothetical protein RHMOL_Rhmol09G0065600 [Rhododendron molle]|uniref:Uncharacterized protein n=1 Tax=Rhododendron molle TaxID=49168 RepID=A0ACC0MAL4_RHOML|nr:hypothetical protein RHMOL_Rhmol09G0065600 [Rhododendron molle]
MVSKSDEYYTHRRLILSSILPNFSLTCSLSSPMYEQSDHAVELDYPFEQRHRPVRIVGSCNGLVCFGNDQEDYMFLWNLSTRKVKRLQDPGVGFVYDSSRVCGFGYDKSNDDYKVVTSRCVFGDGGALEKTELMVQSLRTNSWRRIAGCPLIIALGRTGKFVSGSLHWLAFTMNRSKVIVSVDLAYETGGEVVQPSYGDGPFALTLEVLSGWLCVLCDFYGYRTDVWVMKEYGMRESWTKLFTIIPYLTNPMSFFSLHTTCHFK